MRAKSATRQPEANWPATSGGQTVQIDVLLDVDDPELAFRLSAMLRDVGVRQVRALSHIAQAPSGDHGPRTVTVVGRRAGLEAVGAVHEYARLPAVDAVVVCMDDVQWFNETFAAGADAWVATHVEPDTLLAALRRA